MSPDFSSNVRPGRNHVILAPIEESLECFCCPRCDCPDFVSTDSSVKCEECGRSFPVERGVIDFLLHDQLGETEKQELKATTLRVDDPRKVQHWVDKGECLNLGTSY